MDIKNALNAILPITNRVREVSQRSLKTGTTSDRDANGQQQYQQQNQNQQRGPMSDEQFKKALEYLQSLDVFKEHSLSIEVIESKSKKIVILKEPDGKVLRRINEEELWTLQVMQNEPQKKGQLLRKTA